MWPEDVIYYPWDVWIVTWLVAALWANRTLKRPAFGSEWPYRLVEWGGIALLLVAQSEDSGDFRRGVIDANPLAQRYWALPTTIGWVMVGLAVAGFIFCWWARIYLGRLWSARITRKEDHHIVDTGPVRICSTPHLYGNHPRCGCDRGRKRLRLCDHRVRDDRRRVLDESAS